MPLARVSGLAATLHRRFRPQAVPPPEPAAAAPAGPAFDPAVEELSEVFRRRIAEKWASPEHAAFRNSDLNHVRRYALSLSWIPDGQGRLLDPASGAGHFTEVLRSRRG